MAAYGKWTQIKLLGGEIRQRDPSDRNAEIMRSLVSMKRRALNLQPVFASFLPIWMEQEQRVFEAEGIPSWQPLSPAYASWKAKRFPGKTILRRSDRLFLSLTTRSSDTIAEATPRTIRFGTRVPYWTFHQTGTRHMPARPPMVLLPETWDRLNRMVMAYIANGGG